MITQKRRLSQYPRTKKSFHKSTVPTTRKNSKTCDETVLLITEILDEHKHEQIDLTEETNLEYKSFSV